MAKIEPFPTNPAPEGSAPVPQLIEPSDPSASMRQNLQVIWRRKWSILMVTLIATVIGMFKAASIPPVYLAEAKMLVGFNQPVVAGVVQHVEGTPLYFHFYETQADVLRSRVIAESVVRKLGLDLKPLVPQTRQKTPEENSTQWGTIHNSYVYAKKIVIAWLPFNIFELEPRAEGVVRTSRQNAINAVSAGLSVRGGQKSEILVVGYASTDPEHAAAVANATTESYVEFRRQSRKKSASEATQWLSGRLTDLREEVENSEQALSDYQSRHGLVDTQSRENIISARLGTLSAELIKAQTERNKVEAQFAQLERSLSAGTQVDVENDDAGLERAIAKWHEQKRRVAELSKRYGEKHPKMISARSDLDSSELLVATQKRKAMQKVRKEVQLARVREGKISSLIEAQQSQMRGLSGQAFELSKLEREVAANRKLYQSFLTRFKEADVSQEYDKTNVKIIDPAQVPTVPVRPDRKRIVAAAAFIGLFLGIGLALVRQLMDRTLRSPDDVSDKLNLTVLGSIIKLGSRRANASSPERMALEDPRGVFAESINDIRTALLFSRAGGAPEVLLVTSPGPGDGKTTLASNLALSMRNRGKTILVDCDLRQGRVHQLTSTERQPGVSDVVAGLTPLSEAIRSDPVAEQLYVLPGGTQAPDPLELLSSERFDELIRALREQFDYIVLDGPPVLPVSDSQVLATLADGVLVVLRAGQAKIPAAKETLRRLEHAGARLVGAVLQQVSSRHLRYAAAYYRYDYSYHGYGGSGSGRS